MSGPSLDELLEFVGSINQQSMRYEIKVLRAIKDWAIGQACDFTEGDKVVMTDSLDMNSLHGWAPYTETMAPGATATVKRIGFNEHYGYWYADIVFDREWSVDSSGSMRWWNGPVDETPDGYKTPSSYDQENYPEGRKHMFAMPVRHLRRAPCPTCSGPSRETVGMVCQTCGTDYGPTP